MHYTQNSIYTLILTQRLTFHSRPVARLQSLVLKPWIHLAHVLRTWTASYADCPVDLRRFQSRLQYNIYGIIEPIPSKEKKKKIYSPLIKPAKFLLHPKRIRQHFRRRSGSVKKINKDESHPTETDKVIIHYCSILVNWCYLFYR